VWDSGALDSGLTEVQFGLELRALPESPHQLLTNKTGVTLAVGDVVTIDSGNDSAVVLADTASTQKQLLVSLNATANNALGRFRKAGIVATLNVTGVVTRGNYLVKSVTTKVAADSGVAQGDTTNPPVGSFAVALTGSGGGGSVVGLLFGLTVGSLTLTIPVKIWIPAAGANNTVAAPIYDLPASNAPVATAYGTSPNKFGGLDHADGASALTSQFSVRLPSDWVVTGGIDITFIWFSASTSTNSAVWTCASKSIADNEDVLAPTFNTTQTVAKANNASANTRNSATITGVDTTGLAAGELAIFRVGRDPTNGSDTLAATAVLIGVELTYRRTI
jgi:hypothetical protein